MTGCYPHPPVRLLWIGKSGSGPEHAIRLLPPLLQAVPDAVLIVAGSEADRSAALHLANDLGIADRLVIPDPAVSLDQLVQHATLLFSTDDPPAAGLATDLTTTHGLPTIVCSPDRGIATQTQHATIASYTAQARAVAKLLQERTTPDAPGRMTADLQLDAEGHVLPLFQRGSAVPRVVKKPSRKADGARRSLLTRMEPRIVPDLIERLGAGLFDLVPGMSFTPIRTLDFSTLGLGDTLMAWAGLYALLDGGHRPVAPGCAMYVQGSLVRIGTALFAQHGLRVLPESSRTTEDMASPVLSPQSPRTWRELYRGTAGPDWRVNCFPAVDAQKAALRADYRYDPWERFCLGLTERLLHRRHGWQAAPAEYVGYRLWMPVARKMGLFPVTFLALFKQSLPHLRIEMRKFVESLGLGQDSVTTAIFPSGRSYQAFPADFCRELQERLQPSSPVIYVTEDDPWIDTYREAGLNMVHLRTLEELLGIVLATPKLITTDSFTSHAAQLLRDDFLLVLTRDIRENVLHPGANPMIVTNHPRCAPCHYVPRVDLTSCPARYDRCIAFENKLFLDRIAKTAGCQIGEEVLRGFRQ